MSESDILDGLVASLSDLGSRSMDGTWHPPADAWATTQGRAVRERARLRRPRRAARPVDRRPGLVLGRRRASTSASRSRRPTTTVLDDSDGIPWARWFTGGRTNLADACVDRWAETTPDAEAIVWEGEEGATRTWTYRQLRAEADGLARLLEHRGVAAGDTVGHLPADAPGDGRRGDGGRQARRGVRPGVLRVRRRGGPRAPRGRRRQGADHRRRLPPTRQAGADARDGARGGRRHTDDRRRRSAGHRRRLRRPGAAVAAARPARRSRRVPSTASTRCSSPTRRARPAGRRAWCTSTAGGR